MRAAIDVVIAGLLLGLMLGAFAEPAVAEENWNPFKQCARDSGSAPAKGMASPARPSRDRANLQPRATPSRPRNRPSRAAT